MSEKKNIQKIPLERAIFLLSFVVAKGFAYISPLVIALLVVPYVYGNIEYYWSASLIVGQIICGHVILGILDQGIKDNSNRYCRLLAYIAMANCFFMSLLLLAIVFAETDDWIIFLGVFFAFNIAQQVFGTIARILELPSWTAWADTFHVNVVCLSILTLILIGSEPTMVGLSIVGIGWTFMSTLAVLIAVWPRPENFSVLASIKRTFNLGLPMLANAVLATWLAVYGRILIGMLAAESVAAYGVMFRVAGLALAVHQLAVTALFARIYGARTKEAERLLMPFLIAVVALLALLSLSAPALISYVPIAALDARGERQFAIAFPIVAVQILFWIAFAMLQMRINRSGLAARAFMPMLLVTLIGTGLTVIVGWLSGGDLGLLCWAIALQSAALFAVEWFVLARARLPHKRLGKIALSGGLLLSAIALLNQFLHMAVLPTA